jgi:hypothetical protein
MGGQCFAFVARQNSILALKHIVIDRRKAYSTQKRARFLRDFATIALQPTVNLQRTSRNTK